MGSDGPVIKVKKGVFVARGQRVVAAARINVEIVREVTRKMKEAGLSVWDMLKG